MPRVNESEFLKNLRKILKEIEESNENAIGIVRIGGPLQKVISDLNENRIFIRLLIDTIEKRLYKKAKGV